MNTPAKYRVSGSRVAALWDEHRYWTRRMLWEYTATGRDVEARPADQRARSGRALEHAVLQMAAEDLRCEVVPLPQRQDAYIRHPDAPLGCIADGYVMHPERGPGIVSAKCVSQTAWLNRWMPMQHGVPRDVEMQLQAELLVWSAGEQSMPAPFRHFEAPRWGCIAAMNDLDLHLFERQPEPAFHAELVGELAAFFRSIAANDPPALQYTAAELKLAADLWPAREGADFDVIDCAGEQADLAEDAIALLLDATERRKAAERDTDEAKVRLLEAAAGHRLVRAHGHQCRVTHVNVRESSKACPSCGTDIITRAASSHVRFTPKAI